jgi:hypothetical protein
VEWRIWIGEENLSEDELMFEKVALFGVVVSLTLTLITWKGTTGRSENSYLNSYLIFENLYSSIRINHLAILKPL